MRLERTNNDWIEDYLDGVLSPEEITQFNKMLESDAGLQEELEVAQKIRSVIKKDSGLRGKLMDIEDELEKEGVFNTKSDDMKSNSQRWILGIAASLLLVVGAVWFINQGQGNDQGNGDLWANYEEVWNNHLEAQKTSLESLGFADDKAGLKDSLSMALNMMDEGSYDSARKLLYTLTERHPDDYQSLYYYGYNQMNLGNYKIAFESFDKVRKSQDDLVRYDAHYYYALLLTKFGNDDIAIKEFKLIVNDDSSPNKEIARAYLDMLEK